MVKSLCLCLISVFAQTAVHAMEPITISPDTLDGRYIGRHVEYFEDKTAGMAIDDITAREMSSRFVPVRADTVGFGFTPSAYWIRFSVINRSAKDIEWFLEADYSLYNAIDLYVPGPDGRYRTLSGSIYQPADRRYIASINFIFPLVEPPGTRTLYLRIASESAIEIPLKIWSMKPMIANVNTLTFIITLFYGIMGVMFVYNLFIFISLRERAYWYYLLTIASYMSLYLTMDGVGAAYVWGGSRWITDHAFVLVLPATIAMVLQFTRSYLDTVSHTPRIDKTLRALIVGAIVLFLCSFAVSKIIMSILLVLLLFVSIGLALLVIGPLYVRKRSRAGVYYAIAYLLLLVGSIVRSLKDQGMIDGGFLAHWSPQMGCLCMTILFSLGLADKINAMKNELAGLNRNLEHKVHERTSELQAALVELEAMNHNLTSTMDELAMTNERLVEARDALWGEMQLAKKLQTVLLPAEPVLPGYELTAYMQPADEVGGDYYDVLRFDEVRSARSWMVIGDVSGHGVPAGLMMMMVQTSIYTALAQNPSLDPSELLCIVNSAITRNIRLLGESKYMTITVFACVDDGVFHYSGLHQDLLVYRQASGRVESTETDGMWLGIFDDIRPMMNDRCLNLDPGDSVLLYTDGITEARGPHGDLYSEERLIDMFQRFGSESPQAIKTAILESLKGYSCSDDVTMLIVKKT